MPRTGVVVTALDEQIAFGDFQTAEEFMLLVRRAPDSMGSRQVVLPYSKIIAFKVTDVVDGAIFEAMGFAKPAKK